MAETAQDPQQTLRPTKVLLTQESRDSYRAADGRTMQREYGETPEGNPLGGRWVLRDVQGGWIDFDQYRHDMMERHGLTF
jgi:hypothetical protein